MAFVLEEFLEHFRGVDEENRVTLLKSLKKASLMEVAGHYDCSVGGSSTKREILKLLVEHLIDEELLPEEVVPNVNQGVNDGKNTVELRKLELELKMKEMEMQRENEERQLKFKEKEMEMQMQERLRMRELEVKQREIEVQSDRSSQADTAERGRSFNVGQYLKLSPPIFRESEVDEYFDAFEKMASRMGWPEDKWSVILQSVLTGKAQKVYAAMPLQDSADYESVKAKILDAYEKVPEAYRQQFRGQVKSERQTFCEFATEKEQCFDRWVRSCRCENQYDKLREVFLIEEFVRKLTPELRTYVNEKRVSTLKEAATFADEYALTHKTRSQYQPKVNPPFSGYRPQRAQTGQNPSSNYRPYRKSPMPDTRNSQLPRVTCAYCKIAGHTQSECWRLNGRPGSYPKPVAATGLSPSGVEMKLFTPLPVEVQKDFGPFVSESSVSLFDSPPTKIHVLRDTGAAQSLILKNVLPFSEESYSGTSVLVSGVGGIQSIPLHKVVLESKLVPAGVYLVGVCDTLPVNGVSLLLGNDLAGSRVVSNPCMSDVPVISKDESDLQDIFPECVVTRATARRQLAVDPVTSDVDLCLADSFMADLRDIPPANPPTAGAYAGFSEGGCREGGGGGCRDPPKKLTIQFC